MNILKYLRRTKEKIVVIGLILYCRKIKMTLDQSLVMRFVKVMAL